jgi:hypothetical protein
MLLKLTKERSCGHSFESVMCHEDVEKLICDNKCLKSMACGHHCTKSCKEDCSPCLQLVIFVIVVKHMLPKFSKKVKKIRSCGHATKVACSADPEQKPCRRKRKNTRDCGHDSNGTELCSDEVKPCKVKVLI